MTPCEKLGYKVGDKFEVVRSVQNFKVGDIVKLSRDDGSDCPVFERDDGQRWYCSIKHSVKPLPKLTKSKQWLADAIHNHGAGWPDGAKWAVQNGRAGHIGFSTGEKPKRCNDGWEVSDRSFITNFKIIGHKPQPNWHQTVLSRDEYFSVYPEVSAPSESEAAPHPVTLDMLMKRWEDAKVSVQQAHDAVAAELERRGWNEPTVLDIKWNIGDECVVVQSPDNNEYEGMFATLIECDNDPDETLKYEVKFKTGARYWVSEIKRP